MKPQEREYLRTQFQKKVLTSEGTMFQRFFEEIMVRAFFPDFIIIEPWGKKGDGGNDGYIRSKGIYYQSYAPKNPLERARESAKKFKDDFAKLNEKWNGISEVKEFNFVFNSDKSNQPLEEVLAVLKKENPTITFSLFTPIHLEKIFFELKPEDILALGFQSIEIGISPEQHVTILTLREREIRAELAQTSKADKVQIALLEKELAGVQAQLNNLGAAFEEYKAKLAEAHRSLDGFKQEVPKEQLEQARKALAKGQTKDAEEIFKKVLGLKDKARETLEKSAEAAYQLGELAYSRIDYASAYHYCKEAVELEPDNPLYLNQAGFMAHTIGQYTEAEPFYKSALAIREKALDPDHPNVATSLNNLAALYFAQGRYTEAEPLYQRALDIWEKALGPDHPDVARSLNNLAELYRDQGQYAKAQPLYQRALDILERALGADHPDVAIILSNYADLLRKLVRKGAAKKMEARAKAIRDKK